jgi:hypothetical protein
MIMQRISILVFVVAPAWCQSSSPPRLPNGRPDIQGVWQSAVISADFDVQAHEADGARHHVALFKDFK